MSKTTEVLSVFNTPVTVRPYGRSSEAVLTLPAKGARLTRNAILSSEAAETLGIALLEAAGSKRLAPRAYEVGDRVEVFDYPSDMWLGPATVTERSDGGGVSVRSDGYKHEGYFDLKHIRPLVEEPKPELKVGDYAIFTGEEFRSRVGGYHGVESGTVVRITTLPSDRGYEKDAFTFETLGQGDGWAAFDGDLEGPISVEVKTTMTWEQVPA